MRELHDLVSFPFAAGRKRKDNAKGGGRHMVEGKGWLIEPLGNCCEI